MTEERAAWDKFLPVNKKAEKAVWVWKKAILDEEEDLPAELAELQDKHAQRVLPGLKIKRVA
jgi:hypothetical protein